MTIMGQNGGSGKSSKRTICVVQRMTAKRRQQCRLENRFSHGWLIFSLPSVACASRFLREVEYAKDYSCER